MLFRSFLERGHHRQAADKFRNQAILDEVLGLHIAQHAADVLAVVLAFHLGTEADAALFGARTNHLVETVERAATDEQDIGRIDLHELLVRMLAATLRVCMSTINTSWPGCGFRP